MTAKLTVLGGSSPFTAALVDALKAAHPAVPPRLLILYGRNASHLDLVARYAQAQLGTLGWSVGSTTRCAEALADATWVIHQVRYGGMAGRDADERLALAHGVPPDETLGPAGLHAALRMVPALQELSRLIQLCCPQAWVLNLTNPLSIATAVLSRHGVRRCLGLCELPWFTVQEACRLLRLPADEMMWDYSGLNHRGFIHRLVYRGHDQLPVLARKLGAGTLGGIFAADIEELSALPLKYFSLLRRRAFAPPGRAAYLLQLQAALVAELRECVTRSPPSLSKRYLEWYPGSVVPVLAALAAGDGRLEMVNLCLNNDIAWEVRARVFADRCEPIPTPQPGQPVQRWLELFYAHERAVLAAALEPTRVRIEAALAADPLVPDEALQSLTQSLRQAQSSAAYKQCVLV
jgi:6-phospho-beta-glucosidase